MGLILLMDLVGLIEEAFYDLDRVLSLGFWCSVVLLTMVCSLCLL
jgi:hypothetical protein